ncbi:amino acid ABC transporter permease [Paenibacillus sp. MER 180]|uniref:amino acid ABC transporter permease n=1 Tax=Paenibacillus sp. MER 180 TaxID=2939570 RepID=UPI00203AE1B0|nr:amino acid ABC transporter permease [Paenibacillus sp. MER 180]MCM3290797.1 amino acid ABC transporter permease [Paenibacillus sp. MER 180]
MFDWFDMLWTNKLGFVSGAGITVLLSAISVLFGLLLGVAIVLMRMSKIKPLKWFAVTYIEVFRGTPLLVQLFIIHYGLAEYGVEFSALTSGAIALSLNSGAYLAEIFRAGIQSIDHGQLEAARSLGMSKPMGMRLIVLPQAFRNVIPAIGNEFITIIKETSIVSTIGIADLMFETNIVRAKIYSAMGPLIGAACIYLILTFTLSKVVARLERKLSEHD